MLYLLAYKHFSCFPDIPSEWNLLIWLKEELMLKKKFIAFDNWLEPSGPTSHYKQNQIKEFSCAYCFKMLFAARTSYSLSWIFNMLNNIEQLQGNSLLKQIFSGNVLENLLKEIFKVVWLLKLKSSWSWLGNLVFTLLHISWVVVMMMIFGKLMCCIKKDLISPKHKIWRATLTKLPCMRLFKTSIQFWERMSKNQGLEILFKDHLDLLQWERFHIML